MVFRWFKKQQAAAEIRNLVNNVQAIIRDYGAFLEANPIVIEIMDERLLPHPKATILDALCAAIALPGPTSEMRETLIQSALSLAQFQKGVGKHTLSPFGVDMTKFDMSAMSTENLAQLVLSNPAGKERYDRFKPSVEADIRRIGERVKQANNLHRQAVQK